MGMHVTKCLPIRFAPSSSAVRPGFDEPPPPLSICFCCAMPPFPPQRHQRSLGGGALHCQVSAPAVRAEPRPPGAQHDRPRVQRGGADRRSHRGQRLGCADGSPAASRNPGFGFGTQPTKALIPILIQLPANKITFIVIVALLLPLSTKERTFLVCGTGS